MQGKTSSGYSNSEIWENFITIGNTESLELVYNSYFEILFNYGSSFNCESQYIEDAIQNVFINLIRIRSQLRIDNNPHAYLVSSFRNELMHILARNKRVFLFDKFPESIDKPEKNQEEILIRHETDCKIKYLLINSIKMLTPGQQEIIYMKFNAGLSYKEISETLNISVESCRTAIYRAVKEIRKIMDGKDPG